MTTSVSYIARDKKGRFLSNNNWLAPIIDSVNDLKIKGLETTCPVCNEKGLIITKWVQGGTLKPLTVIHFKSGKFEKVCNIDEQKTSTIRGHVRVLKRDILELMKKRKPYLLFSGGKDSIATLLYLKKIANNLNDLTVVHVDTIAGLPENLDYVKKVCNYLDVNLEIVHPKVDYFTLAKEWGIPSFGFRWCCRELTIKPISEYFSDIKEPKVVFDGIRAAESNVRKQYIPIWYHPGFKCLSVSAIFNWSDTQVYSIINSNGLPKTKLQSVGCSSECWCGAYKTENDFINLYDVDRQMFYKLASLEKEIKTGYTFLFSKGQKKSLWDLEKQIKNSKTDRLAAI